MIDYQTFLFRAIELGNYNVVETMLRMGAPVDAVTMQYDQPRTALWVAALRQRKDICKLLLKQGASFYLHVNDDGKEFPNFLYMVVWDTELTLDLIEQGLDPAAVCPLGLNLTWWAAYAENQHLVIQLENMGIA